MNEEIFHQYMLTRGGRLVLPGDHPLAEAVASYRARGRSQCQWAARRWPEMPRVHFDIIANPEIGACAFVKDGGSYIGVNWGVYGVLQRLFGRMMADAGVLPHIGDTAQESGEDLPPMDVAPTLRLPLPGEEQAPTPRCPVRLNFTIYLAMAATDFLVLHEIYHHADGHLGLIADRQGLAWMAEFEAGQQSISPLIRQVMEWDADSMAASKGAEYAVREVGDGDGIIAFENPMEAFFSWSFAICALFRVFGDSRFTDQDLSSYYQPFRLRQTITLVTAVEHVRISGYQAEGLSAQIARAMAAAEDAFARVTGEPRSVDGLTDALRHGGEHLGLLNRLWAEEVRPMLLPFAYARLVE